MGLQRVENWDTVALHEFLLARAAMPFAWGSNDCALFAADAVQAMTGVDIAGDFRGKYADEIAAFQLIRTVTGVGRDMQTAVQDAAAWCARHAELVEHPYALQAKRGDLVVVEDTGRLIAGVVSLTGRDVVSVGEAGLLRLPLTAVKRAWAV